ncbi:MAG TPA: alpha/beta fold hydrolase, partial [Stellaceae bacterium]|nr:alpha/beta fold hydrolase [Stellaceae bacterium]
TASGKLDRRALPAPVWREGSADAPPEGAVEELLAGIWSELLGIERVGRQDSFFELGGHSLLATRLISRLRAVFGVELALRAVFEQPSLAALAAHIARPVRSRFAHLLPLQQSGEGPALFCIHPAGGAAFCYLPLAAALGREQQVYGLQAKGLEPGEKPARSVAEMARDYIGEIRTVQPNGPYHLLGWSFGGLIAFEIATQLQAAGEQVALLALLDTALHQPEGDDEITEASVIETLVDVLGLEKIIPGVTARISDLDSFVDAARHSGIWPADFSAAHAAAIVELFKVNVEQSYRYFPGRYRGPLLHFRAMQNPENSERYFDWSNKVEGEITVIPLACAHNRVPLEPNVSDVARTLRPLLEAARGPAPPEPR